MVGGGRQSRGQRPPRSRPPPQDDQVAAVNGGGALLMNRNVPSGPEILPVFGEVAADTTPTSFGIRASRSTWLIR
jgi:hypothetical protein